jgi:hypothetical protein
LQIVGMVLLPLSMVLEVTKALGRSYGVSDMLVLLIFGFAIFYLGRVLEGYGQRT